MWAEGVVGHLKGEFGHMRAVDIDTPAIKRYVAKRQAQGRMNGTINRELAAIKRTFNLVVRSRTTCGKRLKSAMNSSSCKPDGYNLPQKGKGVTTATAVTP